MTYYFKFSGRSESRIFKNCCIKIDTNCSLSRFKELIVRSFESGEDFSVKFKGFYEETCSEKGIKRFHAWGEAKEIEFTKAQLESVQFIEFHRDFMRYFQYSVKDRQEFRKFVASKRESDYSHVMNAKRFRYSDHLQDGQCNSSSDFHLQRSDNDDFPTSSANCRYSADKDLSIVKTVIDLTNPTMVNFSRPPMPSTWQMLGDRYDDRFKVNYYNWAPNRGHKSILENADSNSVVQTMPLCLEKDESLY